MTEEEFLQLAKSKFASIKQLKEKPTFLDYEQGLVDIVTELGRQILEAELKGEGKDRRKKKQ